MWYRKLGFYNNPFSIKPAAYQDEMVAYDLDYIYDKIENAEMVFIEGSYGTGKTTILKNIINRFRGKNKLIYYSFISGYEFSLRKLLDGANTFVRRLAGLKAKNVILLLDEVQMMSKKDAEEILKYYQSGDILSVVFVTHVYDGVDLPEDIHHYLGEENIIRTVPLSYPEAFELVRSRIGDIDLYSQKVLKRIYDYADKNPRRFLEYCEDVARYSVELDEFKVNDSHVDAVLGHLDKKKSAQRSLPQVVETKFVEKKHIEQPVAAQVRPVEQEIKPKPVQTIEQPKPVVAKEPKQEIASVPEHEMETDVVEAAEDDKGKKYKVNKLVEGKKDPLGTVAAKEDEKTKKEDIPEYEVFVFDT